MFYRNRTVRLTLAGIYSANEGDWQVFARLSAFTEMDRRVMFKRLRRGGADR
jgi:hypothetical protein